MGVSERNPVIAELFSRFYSLLNDGQYDEAEKVLDEIDGQRDYHDKEVAADRVKLKLERIRGGQKWLRWKKESSRMDWKNWEKIPEVNGNSDLVSHL